MGKGGKPTKKKEALTDQQVAVLLDTVKGLPPYLFIMLGLYSGLRRAEILALDVYKRQMWFQTGMAHRCPTRSLSDFGSILLRGRSRSGAIIGMKMEKE